MRAINNSASNGPLTRPPQALLLEGFKGLVLPGQVRLHLPDPHMQPAQEQHLLAVAAAEMKQQRADKQWELRWGPW